MAATPEDSPDARQPAVDPAPAGDLALLLVARVLRPHGTQGEVACEIVTEFPQRFRRTKRVFLSEPTMLGRFDARPGRSPRELAVIRARLGSHRGRQEVTLQLDGVEDRDAAEKLRGWLVQVPESEAWRLPRGRYYWHQLIGLNVRTEGGEELGVLADILETGANDVYVVKNGDRERLLPAIVDVVKEIAPERGEMVVALLPGL